MSKDAKAKREAYIGNLGHSCLVVVLPFSSASRSIETVGVKNVLALYLLKNLHSPVLDMHSFHPHGVWLAGIELVMMF